MHAKTPIAPRCNRAYSNSPVATPTGCVFLSLLCRFEDALSHPLHRQSQICGENGRCAQHGTYNYPFNRDGLGQMARGG